MNLKNHKFLIFILIIYLVLAIISLFLPLSIWWDSASYIGTGKFMFSNGETGVFEFMRPLMLPFLFGLIWKLGLPVILSAKILEICFTLLAIIFTYLLTKEIFDKKIANLTSAILLFNFLFFFFSFKLYTEIPSICFIMASLYFMLKFQKENKYHFLTLSSLFAVCALFTRYPLALIFIPLNLIILFRKQLKAFLILNFSAFIFSLPYLIYNYVQFGNPIHLFLKASRYYSEQMGISYSLEAFKYGPHFVLPKTSFIYLLTIMLFFNILLPFLIYGFYKVRYNKNILLYIVLPAILFFTYAQITFLKEERYILQIFPMLAIFTAYGLTQLKKHKKIILLIYVLITLAIAVPMLCADRLTFYDTFFTNPPINETCNFVATADPHSAINYKTDFLYEVFDENWKPSENIKNHKVDCIFYRSCSKDRDSQIKEIEDLGYKTIYTTPPGGCNYRVLKYKSI